MVNNLKLKLQRIILFGYSIGSAPSIHLAMKSSFSKIAGLILLAPIASAMKLVDPNIKYDEINEEKDIFCNIKKIGEIRSPIFLIHGMKDNIIPYNHSVDLGMKTNLLFKWYPSNGNHVNILSANRTKFYRKCNDFFYHLEEYYTKYNSINYNFAKLSKRSKLSIENKAGVEGKYEIELINIEKNNLSDEKNEDENFKNENYSGSQKIDSEEGEAHSFEVEKQYTANEKFNKSSSS